MNSYTAFLSKVENLYLWQADDTYNTTLSFSGNSELRLLDRLCNVLYRVGSSDSSLSVIWRRAVIIMDTKTLAEYLAEKLGIDVDDVIDAIEHFTN